MTSLSAYFHPDPAVRRGLVDGSVDHLVLPPRACERCRGHGAVQPKNMATATEPDVCPSCGGSGSLPPLVPESARPATVRECGWRFSDGSEQMNHPPECLTPEGERDYLGAEKIHKAQQRFPDHNFVPPGWATHVVRTCPVPGRLGVVEEQGHQVRVRVDGRWLPWSGELSRADGYPVKEYRWTDGRGWSGLPHDETRQVISVVRPVTEVLEVVGGMSERWPAGRSVVLLNPDRTEMWRPWRAAGHEFHRYIDEPWAADLAPGAVVLVLGPPRDPGRTDHRLLLGMVADRRQDRLAPPFGGSW